MTKVPSTRSGVVKVSPPGRLPHLCGLMMPLVLSHFRLRRKAPHDVGAGGIGGADLPRRAGHAPDLRADAIHFVEIGAHAFQHDAAVDVHHVGVAHLAAVHDVGHLHARAQFVGLRFHREDADLAGFHVVEHVARHVGKRPRREIFEDPGVEYELAARSSSCASAAPISRQARSVISVTFSSGWMRRQLHHGVVRAGRQFRIERQCQQLLRVRVITSAAAAPCEQALFGFVESCNPLLVSNRWSHAKTRNWRSAPLPSSKMRSM